jgi:uncharacterized membrane protein
LKAITLIDKAVIPAIAPLAADANESPVARHFLGKPNMKNTALIASAMAAIIGLGVAVAAKAEDAKNEKCYGVAKAGQNDCATASNSCAGTTTSDAAKDAFLYVPTGICAKIAGGSLMPKT